MAKGFKWLEMPGNCLKWLEMAVHCWKLLETAGNVRTMAGNGWKWPKLVEKWLVMAGNNRNLKEMAVKRLKTAVNALKRVLSGWKMALNDCIWLDMAGNGWKRLEKVGTPWQWL